MLRLRIRDAWVRRFKNLSPVSVDGSSSGSRGTTGLGGKKWVDVRELGRPSQGIERGRVRVAEARKECVNSNMSTIHWTTNQEQKRNDSELEGTEEETLCRPVQCVVQGSSIVFPKVPIAVVDWRAPAVPNFTVRRKKNVGLCSSISEL
jgi:hypothetical protein